MNFKNNLTNTAKLNLFNLTGTNSSFFLDQAKIPRSVQSKYYVPYSTQHTLSESTNLNSIFERNSILNSLLNANKNGGFNMFFTKNTLLQEIHLFSVKKTLNFNQFLQTLCTKLSLIFKEKQIYLINQHESNLYSSVQPYQIDLRTIKSSYLLSDKKENQSTQDTTNSPLNTKIKIRLKQIQKVRHLSKCSFLKPLQNRKQEKVFRTYLSCKANTPAKNKLNNNFPQYYYLITTLKKLKSSLKRKTVVLPASFGFAAKAEKTEKAGGETNLLKNRKHYFDQKKYLCIRSNQALVLSKPKYEIVQKMNSNTYYPPTMQRIAPNTILKKLNLLFVSQFERTNFSPFDRRSKGLVFSEGEQGAYQEFMNQNLELQEENTETLSRLEKKRN